MSARMLPSGTMRLTTLEYQQLHLRIGLDRQYVFEASVPLPEIEHDS